MRLVQHKKEAYWFYRFLSVFYDKLVNPLFWTKKMRDECQELADFNSPELKVIDVGSGTGFNTEGIIRKVKAANITCVDQSPHQMAKAKKKSSLQECTFIIGDAEQIPVESHQFDRYISAGSIEYWPHPQQGINEAMRVLKPGGTALIIGPLEPKGWLTRLLATIWMLFPKDEEYRHWMQQAGFIEIKVKYTSPHWISKNAKYGIAIAGKKPPGISPPDMENARPQEEKETQSLFRSLLLIWRVLIGSLAGFLFIPIALLGYLFSIGKQRNIAPEYREKLNIYQVVALIIILGSLTALIWWLIE